MARTSPSGSEGPPVGPLLVLGMGLATSLGSDLRAACAAARAGLLRVAETEVFQVWNQHEGGVEGVQVHAAHPTTFGFEGGGRLIALLRSAWMDLDRQAPLAPTGARRRAIFLAFGDRGRVCEGEALIEDDDLRRDFRTQAEDRSPDTENHRFRRILERALGQLAGPAVQRIQAWPTGHCGFLQMVDRAGRAIAAGELDEAIVGAVDSLLDAETLAWLYACERLKHPAQPTGLMPGEAAVLARLRRPEATPPRQRRQALATIGPVEQVVEAEPVLGAFPGKGQGLAELLRRIASEEQGRAALGWIVSDHNGETYRAAEWGTALSRLRGELPEIGEAPLWLPALAFGDTGAASAGLALARMSQGLVRGYNPAGSGTLLSAAEAEERVAATVSRA